MIQRLYQMKIKHQRIEPKNSYLLEDGMRKFSRETHAHLIVREITNKTESRWLDELNPDRSNKLTFENAVRATEISGNLSLLEGFANQVGKGIHDINDTPCSSSMQHYLFQTIGSTGRVTSLFDKANQDNHIDPKEASEMIPEVKTAISKLTALLNSLEIKKAS